MLLIIVVLLGSAVVDVVPPDTFVLFLDKYKH